GFDCSEDGNGQKDFRHVICLRPDCMRQSRTRGGRSRHPMTHRIVRCFALPVLVVLTGMCVNGEAWAQAASLRAQTLRDVNEALAMSERGEFHVARQHLEQSLARCDPTPNGRECRLLLASGLGSLLQRQAALDYGNRKSLYLEAVAYYD